MAPSTNIDLIIIGAPRSGTNMLREVLCRLPGFGTWPCDEINYVWRHGNARWPSDQLMPEHARNRVQGYIRKAFARQRWDGACDVLVEKTCANSLRIPFVHRVMAEARYVFIHRDPVDAVASAMQRWNAPFELGYTLAKARFVPLSDVPYYGLRFVLNRLRRLAPTEGRQAYWGPRLENMNQILCQYSLPEVCAIQWRECVARSVAGFAAIDIDRFHVVRYEDFVVAPETVLAGVCQFLDRTTGPEVLRQAVANVHAGSVGKGYIKLSDEQRRRVESLAAPAREALRMLSLDYS